MPTAFSGHVPSHSPKNIVADKPLSSNPSAIITVVRDPEHFLGKNFDVATDGTISKSSRVHVSFGIAVQHHVSTHAELATLLDQIGDDPHAAIINSRFEGIEIGEEFVILSESQIEKRLGIPRNDRERQKGVHALEHNGKTLKATGRFKENVRPSNWMLLDRDVDKFTPEKYVTLNTQDWLSSLASFIPSINNVCYVETPSSSSRVLHDGKAVGQGNSHVWVYVSDPADVERFRTALIIRAAQAEMTWLKPRFSRTDESKVIGNSLTTILDPSVLTPGRLVFDGQPTVSSELTISPMKAVVHQGQENTLDTSAATLPALEAINGITLKAGIEMNVRLGNSGLSVSSNDLTLDSEIETKAHGTISVRELIKRGIREKTRCQSPFRASVSWAAFYHINTDGKPFVYDVGTSTTHWLNETEAQEAKVIPAQDVIEQLIPKVKEDAMAALEDDAVNALATIKQHKPANFQRARSAIKQANKEVSLLSLDRSVKARIDETNTVETHHGYAISILGEFTEGTWAPKGHQGSLYVANPANGLWERKPLETLIRRVAERHDAKEHCSRASDYRAIAEHAISLANDETFFDEALNGLACPGGFYQIDGDDITLIPLTPNHRQRVMLDFTPEKMPTPLFDKFLNETFGSAHEGEEEQQITLLQEIVGGIMLGILYKFQIAILFYEPFGRAGKGTLEKQIRQLVPKDFISAISPFRWNQDYHVATLAGKRLNVVGELPENEPIPASAFKTVIGGDLVTGRHPTHRPITFSNEAAHLFMSNHLITTKDQSEAFFARWKILEFPNSRLRSGQPLDEGLAQRIIDNELPGIAYWALEGAARLLLNRKLSPSSAHDRLMAKWRRTTNTLEEFIHDDCVLSPDGEYRRSAFYSDYTGWCSDNGRKAFAKGRVKELLEHNIGLGIRLVELNGYETFRGVSTKAKSPLQGNTPSRQNASTPVSQEVIAPATDAPERAF